MECRESEGRSGGIEEAVLITRLKNLMNGRDICMYSWIGYVLEGKTTIGAGQEFQIQTLRIVDTDYYP